MLPVLIDYFLTWIVKIWSRRRISFDNPGRERWIITACKYIRSNLQLGRTRNQVTRG